MTTTAEKMKDTAKNVQQELLDSAHKVWLAGLGALSTVGDEGNRLFQDLVDKGRDMEGRGRKRAEKTYADLEARAKDVRGRVESEAREAKGRMEKGFEGVWGAVDERVTEVLHRLGVPTRDEIKALTKRVEELNSKVDELRGVKPKAAAAKGRRVYHVATHGEGWKIELEGASRATSTHDTKDEALTAARKLAKGNLPSGVVVHKMDGTIQTRYSYDEEQAPN